ncbi:DNA-binding PucR family transcriptional regulator [Streptomyces puniciscabiei]|uniref:DNA-binding PucR family transcriptional regulator n=1 Tax=Streptomyces puniciscabiei TaxID=164348 RepID=A0A542TJD8_9ACTN|nr:helix-turn-helix domain-containing protein [Streptomyces puniciscabiei]TQK86936.1 DNA-binding PucR family transcriptional regulator [Streptomyces puniciscabiei]
MPEPRAFSGWSAAAESGVTLEQLLSVIGSGALELETAPGGLAAAVAGVAVLDVLDPGVRPRELLLAIGVDAGSAHAVDVLRRAGEAGAAGVVFGPDRPGGATGTLRAVASEAGTPLLFRTPWCSWAQLVGVLRAGLASAGVPPLPTAPDLVPGDLNGLADAVAALVGGAVTVEDTESRVLAYSSTEEDVDDIRRLTILGRRVPPWRVAAMREAGFFAALWGTDEVLHRRAHGEDPERLVCAVRAGGEVLGSLWVAAVTGRPLVPDAPEVLRAAARTAAAHLLHHRTRGADGRLVEDAARAVLEGRGSPEVLAERAGLTAQAPCAVLAVAAASPAAEGDPSRWHALLGLHCATFGHRSVVVPAGGRLLVLVGSLDPDPARADGDMERLGTSLVARASAATGTHLCVGLGEVVPGLARAADSRRSAELALSALTYAGGPRAVGRTADVADTVGVMQVVEALRDVPLARGTSVARLAAHDAESGGRLVETLRAYLDHFGDVAAASRALAVHPNSLRYRLRRITQACGLDLGSADARLLAQLELRLRESGTGKG